MVDKALLVTLLCIKTPSVPNNLRVSAKPCIGRIFAWSLDKTCVLFEKLDARCWIHGAAVSSHLPSVSDGAILQTKRREKRRGRKGESERQAKLTRLSCQAVSVSTLQHSVVRVSERITHREWQLSKLTGEGRAESKWEDREKRIQERRMRKKARGEWRRYNMREENWRVSLPMRFRHKGEILLRELQRKHAPFDQSTSWIN